MTAKKKKPVAKKKAAKKKAAPRKAAAKPEQVLINFKVTLAEKRQIAKLAEEHADGKVSKWMRAAALRWKPRRKADVERDGKTSHAA